MSIYSIQSDATSIGTVANDDTGTPLRTMVDRLVQDFTAIKAAFSPDNAGGIYLGGAVAANLLDDYEEGTFTPLLEGATTPGTYVYSSQVGKYTKIGNMIIARIRIDVSVTTLAGTGDALISGLPFVGGSLDMGAIVAAGVTFPASAEQITSEKSSSDEVKFRFTRTGLSSVFMQCSDLSTTPQLRFTISYLI